MIASRDDLAIARDHVLGSLPCDPFSGTVATAIQGAGFLGRWAVPWLKANGASVVACFDPDLDKAGTTIDGVPVILPGTSLAPDADFVFITARHAVQAVSASLERRGLAHVSLDALVVARDLPAFMQVHDERLTDEPSRATLRAVLMSMLTGDPRHCAAVCEPDQYFCLAPFRGTEREFYVDAGAYVGDSVERFIWVHNGVFAQIQAFEPAPRQFQALSRRAQRLIDEWAIDPATLHLVQAGLSERNATAGRETRSGQLQSMALVDGSDGPDAVPIRRLDDVLAGQRATFIKADVEGMEMPLLRGAAETIRRWTPKLAICVYHYPTDIPQITALLHSLVPNYAFALRHHAPVLMETVLYAWVDR